MAEASNEGNDEIKRTLEVLEPLLERVRVSALLRPAPAGPRRVTSDRARRGLAFIEVELAAIAASLSQLPLPELGPDYVDDDMKRWLQNLRRLAGWVGAILDVYGEACHVLLMLCRAVARFCDFRHCRPHTTDALRAIEYHAAAAWRVEDPCRYKHLLLVDDDGDHTSGPSSTAEHDPRKTKLPQPDAAEVIGGLPLVGIDGPRKKLLRWLMATDDGEEKEVKSRLKVIAIVGPAGVGKTALAMEVCRQAQIRGQYYFQCHATAKVSRNPDMKRLLQQIASQIDPAAQPLDSDELLVKKIDECLQDKRYFIVIDDIWKESDWDIIKCAFPNNSRGSRIMVTTRIRSVARSCCSYSDGLVHEVKPLNEVDSKRLLFTKAFGSEDVRPEYLKHVCDEIFRRCEGIPLFITGMAHWLKEQCEGLQQSSAVCSLEQVPQLLNEFKQTLSPSYDDLPYKLKFLSLLFEKDFLICLGKYLELPYCILDVEEFFAELFDRNVITRLANCKQKPGVEACHFQVNYFMLQFLASKSAEKGFVCTSYTLKAAAAGGGDKTQIALRRLSLHHPDPDLPTLLETMDLAQTRSLTVCGAVNGIPLDKFIYLWVLDLEGWQILKDDDLFQICSKMHILTYLSIRNTRVSKLPTEIKELRYLYVLDISHTQISELPSEVGELQELMTLDLRSTQIRQIVKLSGFLKHLLIGSDGINPDGTVATKIPEAIRFPRNLHTLATVDVSEFSARFLAEVHRRLQNIRVLAITWSSHQCTDRRYQDALRSFLEESYHLKSLSIHCGLGCSMEFLGSHLSHPPRILETFKVTTGRFFTVPQWIQGSVHLSFLQITVCKLGTNDLNILGGLPKLERLVLGLDFLPGEAIVIDDGVGFRRLQRFSVDCRLPWLTFERGAMREMTDLELIIDQTPASQQSMPSGIGNLLSLELVAIRYRVWNLNSSSVKATVDAMRKQVAELHYPVKLVINGIKDDVQAVHEATEKTAETTSVTEGEAGSEAQLP